MTKIFNPEIHSKVDFYLFIGDEIKTRSSPGFHRRRRRKKCFRVPVSDVSPPPGTLGPTPSLPTRVQF